MKKYIADGKKLIEDMRKLHKSIERKVKLIHKLRQTFTVPLTLKWFLIPALFCVFWLIWFVAYNRGCDYTERNMMAQEPEIEVMEVTNTVFVYTNLLPSKKAMELDLKERGGIWYTESVE